ncbi:MAG: TolC family outer membrane protein [Proteobacteria bacterium]|nr:TolC family outer membrane protein [Pseudomonadota bacterium]
MRVMYKSSRCVLLLIVMSMIIGRSITIMAEEGDTSSKMTLARVLEIVTETNPEILEAQTRYRSVFGERSIASSGYLPKVGTELTLGQEVTDGVDTNDTRENLTVSTATLYARQNLYNGGKTKAFVNETDARILAAAYDTLNVANSVYLETTESYIKVLQARKMLELSEINVMTQEKILDQVRQKTDSGFNRISDLKNSEARLALSRSNYISRQQDLNQAVVKFHRQFGRFIKAEDFIMPEPAYEFPETVEETVDIAFNNHPAIDVSRYNIQVRKYTYEKATSDDWPSLDLELKAQRSSNTGGTEGDTDQLSAMLKMNYIIFDGGVRKGEKIRSYEYLHKENQRAYVERRNVNETVRLSWNILQAEIHKKKYLASYVDLSSQTLEAFKEEYHIGRRTLLDLLNMENEYNSAKNSKAESDFSYLIAYYRISQATGMLLQEFDMGLRESLNLPAQKGFDLKGYGELAHNRDVDSMEDYWDQCDNSITGSDTPASGCEENHAMILGYQEPTELSPYIIPREGTPKELDLKIDKRKDEQTFHLDIINFKSDSDELTAETQEKLSYVADQLTATDFFTIEVIGHTDYTGSAEYNMRLSEKRAKSVAEELIKLGVQKECISWSGKGEYAPIATNGTEEGKSKNRRTEFKLIKKQPD